MSNLNNRLLSKLLWIYYWVISKILWKRRRRRTHKLHQLIQQIISSNGDSGAIATFEVCEHYHEYYCIPLEKAGFKGTLNDLRQQATKSVERAHKREEETLRNAAVYVRNS
ncbi:MAG: hypothetical protein WC648_00975 [Candidatus Paceibacterota bacterium]